MPNQVAIETVAGGVVLPVRAQAGARVNAIRGVYDGALKVSVAQAPEKGKANKAIIEVLCQALGLRKSQIELIAGETSPVKRFLVRDVGAGELSKRIERSLRP